MKTENSTKVLMLVASLAGCAEPAANLEDGDSDGEVAPQEPSGFSNGKFFSVGDYNGDGIDDMLWRRFEDGTITNVLGTAVEHVFQPNELNFSVEVPLSWEVDPPALMWWL